MDYVSNLPVEILEEIFLYLSLEDLVRCSFVSLQWREVVNSNKIWSIQCSKEKILNKEYLESSCSLITNPVERYREPIVDPNSRLSALCHWRLHHDRYKFLERNWRKGNYSMIRTNVNAEHYIEGLLISVDLQGLAVHSIHNLNSPMFIKKADPRLEVDAVRVKDGLLFYTQDNHVICMKRKNSSFVKHYEIIVDNHMKTHSNHRSANEPMLSVKVTDKFMVIQDKTNACFLSFYNYKTGECLRRVKLHTYTGHLCPQFTCLEALEDKVFIAYSLTHHHVIIYDYRLDKVDVKVETSLKSSQLVVSKNFFCSKLTMNQLEKSCEVHVWSVHSGVEVDLLCTNRHLPVLITPDDKLIYSEHYTVYVRGLFDTSQDVEFNVECRLHGIESAWGNLLVINLGSSLQLYDLLTGQKLHTCLRETIDDMWVDDRHIVVRTSGRPWQTKPGCLIAFW